MDDNENFANNFLPTTEASEMQDNFSSPNDMPSLLVLSDPIDHSLCQAKESSVYASSPIARKVINCLSPTINDYCLHTSIAVGESSADTTYAVHTPYRFELRYSSKGQSTVMERLQSSTPGAQDRKGCMQAVMKPFVVTKKREFYNKGTRGPCKRFVRRWQRMIGSIAETNRSTRVKDMSILSPTKACAEEPKASVEIGRSVRIEYKPYYREKYKSLFCKRPRRIKSLVENSGKLLVLKSPNGFVDSGIRKRHKVQFDANSAKQVIESPKEATFETIRQNVRAQDKSEVLIKDLEDKYHSLYDCMKKYGQQKAKVLKGIIRHKKYLLNSPDISPNIEPTINLPEFPAKKSPSIETTVQTILKRTDSQEENKGKTNQKTHIGSEGLPEFIRLKLEAQSSLAATHFNYLQKLVKDKWGLNSKLKMCKAKECYFIIPYGANCLLSNCCNSLTAIKITEEKGATLYCMHKKCIMKFLEWFPLSKESIKELFHDNESAVHKVGKHREVHARDLHEIVDLSNDTDWIEKHTNQMRESTVLRGSCAQKLEKINRFRAKLTIAT